jgi:hypothetical protein
LAIAVFFSMFNSHRKEMPKIELDSRLRLSFLLFAIGLLLFYVTKPRLLFEEETSVTPVTKPSADDRPEA